MHALHVYYSKNWVKQLNGRETEFRKYYDLHREEYEAVLNMLSDEFSKKTYKNVLKYRLTMDIKYLDEVNVKPQYFCKDIFIENNPEFFIDGGAFIGDTVMDLLKYWNRNPKNRYYLWECESENINAIKRNLKGMDWHSVPYAMWSEKAELKFCMGSGATSHVANRGGRDIMENRTGSKEVIVPAESIDDIHGENGLYPCIPTFIKMDIEGAEQYALEGARKLITKCRPKLAISIYHSEEDLWKIPLMIREMVPDYKFYIRHHSDMAAETVLYANISRIS